MRIAIAASLIAIALVGGSAGANHNACNPDPDCNQGVGGVPGYTCVRSEVNTVGGDQGNGRVCVGGTFRTTNYVYLRGVSNREPVVVCRDFEQVFPERDPNAPDFCARAH